SGADMSAAPGFQPDTATLAVDVSLGNTIPTEGATYTLTLSPSNPTANNKTITGWVINWGDGQTTTLSSPNILPSVTHTYEEGTFTITAVATDDLGNTASISTASFSVADAALTAGALTPPT